MVACKARTIITILLASIITKIKLKHPDLAFVYLTDHTSPADRWQDYRKRIRGEHLRVNEQQMDALQKRFHIQVWPTYILMDTWRKSY